MSGTYAPAPGAAPLSRQVLTQARMEARLMLRNGEQLLLAVVIPVIVLIGGVAGSKALGVVASFCERNAVEPDALAMGQRTLEDVFLQLTGREFEE